MMEGAKLCKWQVTPVGHQIASKVLQARIRKVGRMSRDLSDFAPQHHVTSDLCIGLRGTSK